MIGLALEGGGVRGSYQAGVYAAMHECGIKINGVCGTSIGSLNASLIATGKGETLASVWRSLNMGEVFGFSKKFIDASINKKIKLSNAEIFAKEAFRIMLQKGIELEGLKQVIDKYLDVDALFNSDIDFGLVTVRLKDFKPIYLWKSDMDKEKIKDYVIASSSLPLFKMEPLIDNHYYLDGGFRDLGPVNMMLEKGYDTVYLVKIHGIGITRKYDKSKNVIVIESKRGLGGVLDLDKTRIEENIKMGYYDAIRVIKHLDGEKYVFKVKSEKYYEFLNRKVPKKLQRRIKSFFKARNIKEATIRAFEYVMEHEHINYYEIYKPTKMLRKLKKIKHKNHFIYDYISKLKYLL